MKYIYTIILVVLTAKVWAQAPEKMSYQALIRDASNDMITSQSIGMRISIIQGSPIGMAVYVETHTPVTNLNGLISLEIGTGTIVNGSFSTIDWANGTYYIQTETDPNGGTNYTIEGISQFMSVPYALHAKTATSLSSNSNDPFYLGQDTLGGIVYYLYKDEAGQQHGLIVNKNESTAAWQATNATTGANSTWNGENNTSLMLQVSSPAATYATSLGAGWYLPSLDEMILLWNNRFIANQALNLGGLTLLSTTSTYWTSTERANTYAFNTNFEVGHQTGGLNKTDVHKVRAIKAF